MRGTVAYPSTCMLAASYRDENLRRGGVGSGVGNQRERGKTNEKNVDFPTSASPNNKIVTSGVSAMFTHLRFAHENINLPHDVSKGKGSIRCTSRGDKESR